MIAIVLIGAGLVVWKKKVGGAAHESFNVLTREEFESLLADVAKTNPAGLKRFKDDPEMRKNQIESLKQLMAFASQAQRQGLADDPTNKQEMDNISAEITAVTYDREINKDKGPMPPFGFITDDQVKAYWGQDDQPQAPKSSFAAFMEKLGLGEPADTRTHEAEFQDFLNSKIDLLKASSPEMKDREISEEEKTQARDVFARLRIYRKEFNEKAASGQLATDLTTSSDSAAGAARAKGLIDRIKLQIKLQQATFLSKLYTDSIADKMTVTDDEVAAYIAAHPELDPKVKQAKAEDILARAKAGEDFAALADQYSEDPGNKNPDGTMKGGLYENVSKGRMVGPFEAAALALEPGQIAPQLVETDFGFHIIKLERKLGPTPKKDAVPGSPVDTAKAGDTYDVRHILISKNFRDPDKPNARELPVQDYAKSKLQETRAKELIDRLVAENNVSVPEDFTVPEVTQEQLDEMKQRQQQMQMPPPGSEMKDQTSGTKPGKPADAKPDKPAAPLKK